MRSTAIAIACCLLPISHAGAQVLCNTYDASLGTLPSEQGWSLHQVGVNVTPPSVTNGVLVQSTMPAVAQPTCVAIPDPRVQDWRESDTPIDYADGLVMQAEVRILASEYGVDPCDDNDYLRPGFLMIVRDKSGYDFRVGLGESQLFLANHGFIASGDPGAVELAFDTTDGFHTYRLEVDASGGTLSIDGVPMLAVLKSAQQTSTGPNPSLVTIGDGTAWSNASFEMRSFSVKGGQALPGWEDLGGALAGTVGMPCLTGDGTMIPGSTQTFLLDDARHDAAGYWVMGFATLYVPFKGGLLIPDPSPPGLFVAMGTGPSGSLTLPVLLPAPIPIPVTVFSQWWIQDPLGPFGFSASNGLAAIVQ